MLTAALLNIVKIWKPHKCPSTGEWINKMRAYHTKEYYLALKRNKVLIPTTTWLSLKKQ